MISKNVLVSLGFLTIASTSALPAGTSFTTAKQCVDLEVSVPVVAKQWRYDKPRVDSDIDAMDWTVNVTTYNAKSFSERHIDKEKKTIKDTFKISAKLCVPTGQSKKSSILHIATPGQAFDKRYFDVEIDPEQYSYVDAAISKGYSILFYDRLGTGASSKPDAYDVLQLPTDLEVLASLTKIARSGKLLRSSKVLDGGSKQSTIFGFKPSKIVHVGHAYGSFLMSQMFVKYGNLSDGALMTGVYPNQVMVDDMLTVLNYNHAFPKQQDPDRFSEYGSGYFVLDNEQTLQKLFYQKKSLDPKLLTYTEKIKQPESVGQYASEGDIEFAPAPDFKGPVMFFTGELDNFICNGDCRGIWNETLARGMLPCAKDITPYLQPDTGHASGLSKNASAGYEVMLNYLGTNGL